MKNFVAIFLLLLMFGQGKADSHINWNSANNRIEQKATRPGPAQFNFECNEPCRFFVFRRGDRVPLIGVVLAEAMGGKGATLFNSPGASLTVYLEFFGAANFSIQNISLDGIPQPN